MVHRESKEIKMAESFTGVMKQYFGLNGKTVSEFVRELKALSYEEKCQLREAFILAGIDCPEPTKPEN